MKSPASRRRLQQQEHLARKQLWEAREALAEKQVDIVSYHRVIADMIAQGLPPETRAPLVLKCQSAARREHDRLLARVNELEEEERA